MDKWMDKCMDKWMDMSIKLVFFYFEIILNIIDSITFLFIFFNLSIEIELEFIKNFV